MLARAGARSRVFPPLSGGLARAGASRRWRVPSTGSSDTHAAAASARARRSDSCPGDRWGPTYATSSRPLRVPTLVLSSSTGANRQRVRRPLPRSRNSELVVLPVPCEDFSTWGLDAEANTSARWTTRPKTLRSRRWAGSVAPEPRPRHGSLHRHREFNRPSTAELGDRALAGAPRAPTTRSCAAASPEFRGDRTGHGR